MRLYKLVRLTGDYSVSIFAPKKIEVEPLERIAGEPLGHWIALLKLMGYTAEEARELLVALAHHAKYDLNQTARGVRVYIDMILRKMWEASQPPHSIMWAPLILALAAFAAIAAAVWLWMELDSDGWRVSLAHPWAYVMRYNGRLWQAEILAVGPKERGVYELGPEFGEVLVSERRNLPTALGSLDEWGFFTSFLMEGRPIVFWHRSVWILWDVFFCGMCYEVGRNIYMLKEGGRDPYLPAGPWFRPGDRWGTPGYKGCWKPWWWVRK